MDLLSILFKFTFSQKNTEAFLACLEIWDEFLDQLMVLEWSKFLGERPSVTYQELLVSLFNESLNKAQVQFSADLLMTLDNEETDESGETERSSFITANIEIIARICCLKPMDILTALIPNLKSTVSQFLSEPQSFTDAKILDLGTLLQVAGRLTEHFLGEEFQKFEEDVKLILELILELAEKLYQVVHSKSHSASIIELHCQVLSALRPYQHWLSQFYAKAQNTLSIDTKEKLESAPVVHLSRKVLHISIPVLLLEPSKETQKIQKVAAQLLQCWASIVRPHFADILASELGELYSIGGIGPSPKNIPLTEETKTIVLKALASLFLLPYPNTTQADQKWPERTELFTSLVKSQSARFDFISSCCFLVYSESVACRKSCSAGIRNIVFDCVPHINTFNVDIKETKAAMNLTTDYFNCMKQEATKDMELTRRTVQACYEGFSVEKANELLLKEEGVQFLENMTKIISAVVEYCKDAEILPVVLNLTMNIILPASEMSPPVHAAGLTLLKRIISVKYRFFFPGNVLSSHFKSNSPGSSYPKIQNEQTLMQIIRYFITAITSTDLTLSRNALNLLLELQKERKFFSNDAVRVNINPLIVGAVSSTLLAGQHLIIEDELITLLHHTFYENKICDLQSIFTNTLPKHLSSYTVPSLNTDFPTFLSIIRSVLIASRG
ncbi:Oidioi.mRNA.OKI2018_I69.chr1.g2314.t1.cds [Oikopleura dioica]|uniref:Oidioi.mRNA.OKI2018_I69.chr1.g2314.t1.cds n=1 Tax=Oikopleura dioica TaxID=34765 RepID=A0ABN7SVX3_OIKDI|nr:Oidioi.mRNA.OKI2018_I69.chr1.g2314.t1.cds [Oikopleura dioica]